MGLKAGEDEIIADTLLPSHCESTLGGGSAPCDVGARVLTSLAALLHAVPPQMPPPAGATAIQCSHSKLTILYIATADAKNSSCQGEALTPLPPSPQ